MATNNNRVRFTYVTGNSLPASPDGDTVYFVAGLQALYVGENLIADHQDLSSYALAADIPTITVTGSGDDVVNAVYDSATKTLTITKGDLSSKYVEVEAGKGLSTNDYTTEEKTKLAGIEAGAEVNQNAFSNVKVGATTIAAASATDQVELIAGTNVTLTPDASNKTVTIAATDTTYSAATSSADGLMSSTDKAALDAITAEVSGQEDHLVNVQADWSQTTTTADDYIKNKPTKTSDFTNDGDGQNPFLTAADIDDYTITKATTADTGYAATYQLFKGNTAVGDKINIPKDMVVSAGEVKTVTTADVPYQGAVVGDKYIDLTLANATNDHIYIPVKDLVDVYTGGTGIDVSASNVISVDETYVATRTYAEQQALKWTVL